MSDFYIDIETTGLDPAKDEIITIQYQKLDFNTKEPDGPLIILKAWESSEKEILEKFNQALGLGEWSFVPHGYNLKFEDRFLYIRSLHHGIQPTIKLLDRPSVDIHAVGILLNGGRFKGSGLDKISGKKQNGLGCLEMYKDKNYKGIVNYVNEEAKAYTELYAWLVKKMPEVLIEFQASKI